MVWLCPEHRQWDQSWLYLPVQGFGNHEVYQTDRDFVINADDVESMSRLAQIKEWKPDFDGARFEYLLEFDAKILHPIVRQCAATKLFIVRQEAGNDQGDRFHFDIQRIADAIGAP